MSALRRTGPDGRFASPVMLLVSAAGLSACALALYAHAEWPWLLLGWFALVPWLASLDHTASTRGALVGGLFMSQALIITCYYWLPSAIRDYSGISWGLCLFVIMLAAPLLEPQFIALALTRRFTRTGIFCRMPLAPLAGACAYVGAEWAIPKLFPATLGHPLFGSTLLRQGADVAGAHGLTFMLLLANDCVLAIIRGARSRTGKTEKRWRAPAACLAVLILVPLGYGALRFKQFNTPGAGTDTLTAGLVQAGLSDYDRLAAEFGAYDTVRTILDTHEELSLALLARRDIDLIVWPETVYPLTFNSPESEDGQALDLSIEEFVTGIGVPLAFGAYDIEEGQRFNAAFFLSPLPDNGMIFTSYRKSRLFPFTEWAPPLFDNPDVRARMPWLGDWTPGSGARAVFLRLADGRTVGIAPLICYDALDPAHVIAAVRAGGDVILTLSNDSWFAYGNIPRFILMLSAFRSIETRRPQLRATNTGITAVIAPTGEIVDMLDVNTRGVLVGSVNPGSGKTLMLLLGDWFGPAALAAALLMLGAALTARSRKMNPSTGSLKRL
ncbi:MAG: apolipoprotein N-acyltransferase [Desulfobacteraceae bacterium]|nr:MAG: apolipoprotein N-acyltransferase [Desulfobacteraceae bacterium]